MYKAVWINPEKSGFLSFPFYFEQFRNLAVQRTIKKKHAHTHTEMYKIAYVCIVTYIDTTHTHTHTTVPASIKGWLNEHGKSRDDP